MKTDKFQKFSLIGRVENGKIVEWRFMISPGFISLVVSKGDDGKWGEAVRLWIKDKVELPDGTIRMTPDDRWGVIGSRDTWLRQYKRIGKIVVSNKDDEVILEIPKEDVEGAIAVMRKNDRRIKF